MGTLIDSSVLIALERGRLDADEVFAAPERRDRVVAIAAITASELLHGLHHLGGVRRVRAQAWVSAWLDALPVIPFGPEVARVHATIAAQLGEKGTAAGPHDLMIAATAVHLGYRVATLDRRTFDRIDGLAVEYL